MLGDDEDRALNDPEGQWQDAPSFRCLMTRHDDCDPHGAEHGCTCLCHTFPPEKGAAREAL